MSLARIVIQERSTAIIFLRECDGECYVFRSSSATQAWPIDRRLKGYKKARPMTQRCWRT